MRLKVETRQFEVVVNKKAPFSKRWNVFYDAKENFVSELRRSGKVVFCVFWYIYALKHREYSPF